MPELPEVETIKLGLQKYLIGHKILNIEVRVAKIFQGDKSKLIGARVTQVDRIGKGLIIGLNNHYVLAIHLKLTGQIIYHDKKTNGSLPSKHTHVIFKLDHHAFLYYNDLRKFGWIKVLKKDEVTNLPFFAEMGPEPLSSLTENVLLKIVQSSNLPIKLLLMDQTKIGGLGNIYANETLHEAGIDPRRKAKTLDLNEIKKLYQSINAVLKKALEYGGSSDANYVNALGQDGHYQEHFLVYRKDGKSCPKCGGRIKRLKLAGRGTFFCPSCQV